MEGTTARVKKVMKEVELLAQILMSVTAITTVMNSLTATTLMVITAARVRMATKAMERFAQI